MGRIREQAIERILEMNDIENQKIKKLQGEILHEIVNLHIPTL